MSTEKLVGDFDNFSGRAKAALEIITETIREEIGTQMQKLSEPVVGWKKTFEDLFGENEVPCKLPKAFGPDFSKMKGGNALRERATVYWYYLHSRTHDIERAYEVDRRAFFKPSEDEPEEMVGVTYKAAFGSDVFTPVKEDTQKPTNLTDSHMSWRLMVTSEEKTVKTKFYQITCRLNSNQTSEFPAKLCFQPYMQVREFAGVRFGFKQATIGTSLTTTDSGAKIIFNKIYADGHEIEGAKVEKTGSRFEGEWTLNNGVEPLRGDYSFTGEAANISFKGTEMFFSVELRIDQFSSTICRSDGSPIGQENKREILRMLAGDKILEEHGGNLVDLLLTKKVYRLFKENPFGT